LKRFCHLLAGACLAALLLQACSAVPERIAEEPGWLERYESRAADLGALSGWALQGKLGVSDGNDGGSGKLRWQENGESSRMDFHGALGRGAWRLVSEPGGAELELADGRSYRAGTVGELVRGQLGWTVPVEALSWWVLGLEAPGPVARRNLSEDGTLVFLEQQGWRIEYGRYRRVGEAMLPAKLTARQDDKTVKLAVSKWSLDRSRD